MAESRPPRWPQFELVTFPEPTGFPREWATPLLERGAPKNLLGSRFHAADILTLLEAPPFGKFVRFAACGVSDSLCLNPRTGQIVVIHGWLPEAEPWLVNSSLEQFIESVRLISARFPFDGGLSEAVVGDLDDRGFEAYLAQLDSAVDELRASLRRIDPVVFSASDAYWEEFFDSVQMGDWDTDCVVGRDAD